jgi:hypothetical protein
MKSVKSALTASTISANVMTPSTGGARAASRHDEEPGFGGTATRRPKRLVRDENLRAIRKNGRKKWKEEVSYHRRSLAETTVFRYKTVFGDKAQSRIENQFQEMFVKCSALLKVTHFSPSLEKSGSASQAYPITSHRFT